MDTGKLPKNRLRRTRKRIQARFDGYILRQTGWIEGLKAADYQAEGIVPFVANGPLMSFSYHDAALRPRALHSNHPGTTSLAGLYFAGSLVTGAETGGSFQQCGVTVSTFGVTSASMRPVAQSSPPKRIF